MHRHHTWNCLIIYFHDYQLQWESSWPHRCNQCIMCRCPEPGSPVQDTYWPRTWVGIFISRCHSQMPGYHSWEEAREKNNNKNPITEKAVEELGPELYNVKTDNGPVSLLTLALVTAHLNSRIHQGGLSAREIRTRRDQVTGAQLPFVDTDLIQAQHETRLYNHEPSAQSKTPNVLLPDTPPVQVGDLVYLIHDKDKTRTRDKYMIASIPGHSCQIHKFTRDQFRSKLYEVLITHCIPLSGRQNHPSDDHGALSDKEDGWLPTHPHMSLSIDMSVHTSKSYPAFGPIKPSLVTNSQAPPWHATAPTDVPPEPPRMLVTPTAGGQGPTPHHPPLEMAHQLQQTPANIDVPPHDRSQFWLTCGYPSSFCNHTHYSYNLWWHRRTSNPMAIWTPYNQPVTLIMNCITSVACTLNTAARTFSCLRYWCYNWHRLPDSITLYNCSRVIVLIKPLCTFHPIDHLLV